MYETDRIVQLVHFVSVVRFLAGVRLVFVTSFRIRLLRTWAVHTKDGGLGLVQTRSQQGSYICSENQG
jgi:hypothetical protein